MRTIKLTAAAAVVALLGAANSAHAAVVTFTMLGTADVFAAGGNVVSSGGTLPNFVNVAGGSTITITATGEISCCGASGFNGPGGQNASGTIFDSTGNPLVGDYTGPALGLTAVFYDGINSYNPFIVGANLSQLVPVGATRIYFGTVDGPSYNAPSGSYGDNQGSFTVTVAGAVPEPSTWAMMILGFLGLGYAAYGRRDKSLQLA